MLGGGRRARDLASVLRPCWQQVQVHHPLRVHAFKLPAQHCLSKYKHQLPRELIPDDMPHSPTAVSRGKLGLHHAREPTWKSGQHHLWRVLPASNKATRTVQLERWLRRSIPFTASMVPCCELFHMPKCAGCCSTASALHRRDHRANGL